MQRRVLVVGAGIAGLAVARALHQEGITPDVVEKASDWTAAGAGLFLPGNAVRALGDLGVESALTARANPIRRQRFLTHEGRLLADLDVDRFWAGLGGCYALERDALHEVLRQAAAPVPVQMGKSVTSLSAGPVSEVGFSDGSTASYDLVVGADGIHSTVRDLAFDANPVRPVSQTAWRFLATGFPDITDWEVRLGNRRAFLTIALGGGTVYCYCDADLEDGPGSDKDWRTLFEGFADPVPSLLQQGAGAHQARIEEVVLAEWSRLGVVLIGDAAHGCSPNMAQGVAMAVEDANVLARLIATSDTVDAAVTEFVARRQSRVTWVREQTHRRDRTRGLPSPVRNLSLRLAARRIYEANYRPLLGPP